MGETGVHAAYALPRVATDAARRAGQRAIFHVQLEMESVAATLGDVGLVLCDRGVVDGAAYWPDGIEGLFDEIGTPRQDAIRRYAGVVHLRTPDARGYDHSNPLRMESVSEAAGVDGRIFDAWEGAARRVVIPPAADFVHKLDAALEAIHAFLPECCRAHEGASS